MHGLKKETVYTIRWLGQFDHPVQGTYYGVRLNEIERPFPDVPYCSTRFRPLIERKTDISIFTDILDGVNKTRVLEDCQSEDNPTIDRRTNVRQSLKYKHRTVA